MTESVRKSIDRWESVVKTSDAALVKPEIERLFDRIGSHEENRSNAARKIYSVLVKNLTLKNAANLLKIFNYLTKQSPSYLFSYFLPVLFNKTLELEKEKNYQLGQQIAAEFIINPSLISEIKPENIDLFTNIIQQWTYFHYKGGLPATPTLKSIIVGNIKLVLPFTTSTKYIMILNKFLGSNPSLAPALASIKGGDIIVKEALDEILSFPIRLDESEGKEIQMILPKYVVTALNLMKIDDRVFKSFDQELLKHLQTKIGVNPIISFSMAFCKWNEEPSLQGLTSIANVLTEILSESKMVKSIPLIESCLTVAKCLKPLVDALNPLFDCDSLLVLFKFVNNMIKVLMNCDSEVDRGYCAECKNTKRHVTDVLLSIVLSAFESFGKRMEVSSELVVKVMDVVTYKLITIDGLKCSNKERMIENTIVKLYCILSHEKMLDNPKFTKYKLKMVDAFKKYAKNRTFKNLSPKHILYMYSKVFNMTEFPEKHLLITSLQILFDPSHGTKKSRADQIIKKRDAVPGYEHLSVLEILQKAEDSGFDLDLPKYLPRDIILLEMETIFNYSRNYEKNVKLFNDLTELTSDPFILGHALFLFELDEHNKIPEKCIVQIEADLKKVQPKTMMSEVILGLITMRKYTNMYNRDRESLKDSKFFGTGPKENNTACFDKLQVKSEQTLIKLLKEGVGHFQMALNIASRDKYKGLEELYSCVKIRKSLDTIAIHFEQRGLHLRAMEAQYLAYTISKVRQDELGLIMTLAHFTENLEQYKKLSKREPCIPTLTQDLTNLLEKFMQDKQNLPLYKQGCIYSAYLSLVSYYISQDSYFKAIEILKTLHEPLHHSDTKKHEPYLQILRFKFYVLHQKLLLAYPNASKLSPMAFLFLIMGELNDLVEYRDEFHIYMPNILFKTLDYLLWHQIARYDCKIMEPYVILVFKIAARKGMLIRCFQIYLILTYMDLIGENLNDVETHLSRMDHMLGNEPTKITKKSSSEVTPVKKRSIDLLFDRVHLGINNVIGSAVRREAVESPLPYIMSPPIDVPLTDFAKYMIQHDWKCKCIYCSLPQVKVYAFVLGCFYARMLYLNANYEMAYQFYQKAVEYWRTLKGFVIASNDETLLKNFVCYSLYTQLHMCHCMMQMKKYDELEYVCESIEELLALNVCDNTATIEECKFTISIARDSIPQKEVPSKKFRTFEEFVLDDDIQVLLSPPITKKPEPRIVTTSKKITKNIPIFVDGPKSAKMSPAQKRRILFSKKKDTLDSPNVSELSMDLTTITKSSKKTLSTKVTAPLLKKSASDFSVVPNPTASLTLKRSTRQMNKEIENKPVPTPVKRVTLQKKQLKFSPTLDSPVVLDDITDETIVKATPKSSTTSTRKALSKPKTVTKSKSTSQIVKASPVITIDSDSDTSVINASNPPPLTYQQLSAQRAKRYKARIAAKK